jgi:hypothetical protein
MSNELTVLWRYGGKKVLFDEVSLSLYFYSPAGAHPLLCVMVVLITKAVKDAPEECVTDDR